MVDSVRIEAAARAAYEAWRAVVPVAIDLYDCFQAGYYAAAGGVQTEPARAIELLREVPSFVCDDGGGWCHACGAARTHKESCINVRIRAFLAGLGSEGTTSAGSGVRDV